MGRDVEDRADESRREEEREATSPLTIGGVFGDSDAQSMAWQPVLGGLHLRAAEIGRSFSSPLAVNVVFHLTGRLVQPEFEGARTGSFLRTKNVQIVQTAIWDLDPPDKRAVVLEMLRQSVDAAQDKFDKRRGGLDLDPIRRLIDALESGTDLE